MSFFIFEQVLVAYLNYMTKVGVLLGGEENSTRAQMEDVIDFETKLANVRPFQLLFLNLILYI